MFPLTKRFSSLMLALLLFISASVSANTIAYRGGFVLLSPEDGATGVSLTPTLDWSDMPGAIFYDVQVATDTAFTKPVVDITGILAITSEYTVPEEVLENGTNYNWRVRFSDGITTSEWLEPFDFTTIVAAPSVPVLTSPTNGATGVSLTAALDFEDVKGADSYDIEVADNAAFTDPVISATGLTSSEYNVTAGTLNNNTEYFWRVRAVNTGGTSAFSSAFSFTTIVAAPSVPVLTSPSNGATGVSLTAGLDWEDVKGADSYELQVADNAGFTDPVISATGLTSSGYSVPSGTLSNNTEYFWRVRATNAGGTSAFSSAFSFTTIIGAPGIPVLLTPADGSTGISLTPTLDWEDAANAESYNVQLANEPSFSIMIIDESGVKGSTFNVPSGVLSNSATFYWRVSTTNSGGTSDFSSAFSFTTIAAAPSVPVLVSPINNATGQPLTLSLDWDDAANAETYQLQVSTDSAFSTTVIDTIDLTASSFSVGAGILDNMTTYYWRVSAENKAGNSGYSSAFAFTTIVSQPGVPVLTSPSNGATGQSLTLTFDWEDVENSKGYQIQVSADSTFATTVIDESNVTISQYPVQSGTLTNGTWYYWRVKSDNAGGSSEFSAPFSFRTIVSSPLVPVLVSPANGSSGVQTNPVFDWNEVAGATTYGLQVATDSAFSNLVINVSLDSTSYQDTVHLNENTLHYWRVNATNKGGTGAYSDPFIFTTLAPAPLAPGLLTPENGQTGVVINARLDWSDVGETRLESVYELEVALDDKFTDIVTSKTGLAISEYTFEENLSHNTVHYWRVRVHTEGGTSPWSDVWSFTTETLTGIGPVSGIIPKEYSLYQNYPNPFNPATKIRFDIPSIHGGAIQSAKVVVYNMLGQTVATLFEGNLKAGVYELQFNASMMASGIYFYELKTDNFRSIKRMTLVK